MSENTSLAMTPGKEIGNKPAESTMPVPLETLNNLPEQSNLPVSASVTPGRTLPLEVMFDVPISLVFEIGRVDIPIKQLMELTEGCFIDLNQVSVDVIDVRINEVLIGQAETIAMQQRYGIRMGELKVYTALENEEIDVKNN